MSSNYEMKVKSIGIVNKFKDEIKEDDDDASIERVQVQKRWDKPQSTSFNNYFAKYEEVKQEEKILDMRDASQ